MTRSTDHLHTPEALEKSKASREASKASLPFQVGDKIYLTQEVIDRWLGSLKESDLRKPLEILGADRLGLTVKSASGAEVHLVWTSVTAEVPRVGVSSEAMVLSGALKAKAGARVANYLSEQPETTVEIVTAVVKETTPTFFEKWEKVIKTSSVEDLTMTETAAAATARVEAPRKNPRATKIEVSDLGTMFLHLDDGRVVKMDLSKPGYRKLRDADVEDKQDYRILNGGQGIVWEEIDEDLTVAGILKDHGADK